MEIYSIASVLVDKWKNLFEFKHESSQKESNKEDSL